MRCEKFQMIAGQLARNEMMDVDERAEALSHAEACERCEQVLSWQTGLTEGLHSLAQQTKGARAPEGMEDRVLAAFREGKHPRHIPVSQSPRLFWISAAAAVLLLAVGLFAWRWYVAPAPRQTEQAKSEIAPAAVTGSDREQSPAVAVGTTRPRKFSAVAANGKRSPRRHSRAQTAKLNVPRQSIAAPSLPATTPETETREITTDFVSLSYGSALDLQDGGQMVRVELPRSSLARFGLPMNMNRADEKIKADVLVGADGLARAIRFVQPVDKSTAGPGSGSERNEQ